MSSVPVIGPADVTHLLDWTALCDAMEAAHLGPRAEIGDTFLSRAEDTLLSRSAWVEGLGVGVKSVTVLPGNPAAGRPTVQGAMLVFDDSTGTPRALIDNALITRWKTAADSVLGARFLARAGGKCLLVIGAGAVADALIEAYRAVLGIERVMVWNRTPSRADALCETHGAERVDDLPAAVWQADIVATATLSKTPVLAGADLLPGQHVDLIGAFTSDMREADDALLLRGRLFVDARETTLHHIGELKIPLAAGVIKEADVLGDFHDLARGYVGRQTDEDITVFKNGGGAHLDLITADVILRAAGL